MSRCGCRRWQGAGGREKERTSRCKGRQDGLNTGHNRMRTGTGEKAHGVGMRRGLGEDVLGACDRICVLVELQDGEIGWRDLEDDQKDSGGLDICYLFYISLQMCMW